MSLTPSLISAIAEREPSLSVASSRGKTDRSQKLSAQRSVTTQFTEYVGGRAWRYGPPPPRWRTTTFPASMVPTFRHFYRAMAWLDEELEEKPEGTWAALRQGRHRGEAVRSQG